MDAEYKTEIIRIIPKVLWILVVVLAIIVFRSTIEHVLLPRVESFKGFGIEITLYVENGLRLAANERDVPIDESSLSRVMNRADKAAGSLKNKSILWLDDNPSWNSNEVSLFRALGLLITRVSTEQAALTELQTHQHDIFLSDINRYENRDAGIVFLKNISEKGMKIPAVFYISDLKPELGTPPYAFGITDRPDELLHYIIDIAERSGE